MINRIRANYPYDLNKGCSSKFCVGSRVRQETPEEGQRKFWTKRCKYNNKDEGKSPKTLNDKIKYSYQMQIICSYMISSIHINY